jgi:hypothetical protein
MAIGTISARFAGYLVIEDVDGYYKRRFMVTMESLTMRRNCRLLAKADSRRSHESKDRRI